VDLTSREFCYHLQCSIFIGFIPFDNEFQPKALTPFSYIDQNNPEFIWEAGLGAVSYEIELKKVATGEIVYSDVGIVGTRLVLPSYVILEPELSYHWKVRAFNALGEASFWSDVRGFIVKSSKLLGFGSLKPITLGPSGSILDNGFVEFSWEALPGAELYQVFVYDGLSNRPIYSAVTNQTRLMVKDREFSFTAGKNYVWRMRAVDTLGIYSLPTDADQFMIPFSNSNKPGPGKLK